MHEEGAGPGGDGASKLHASHLSDDTAMSMGPTGFGNRTSNSVLTSRVSFSIRQACTANLAADTSFSCWRLRPVWLLKNASGTIQEPFRSWSRGIGLRCNDPRLKLSNPGRWQ